jgi:hypothetical protein
VIELGDGFGFSLEARADESGIEQVRQDHLQRDTRLG